MYFTSDSPFRRASLVAQTVKESACNVGGLGLIPGLGRSPGGVHGNPLGYSCLENRHGQRSLAGYNPWGCKESDTTELLSTGQCINSVNSKHSMNTNSLLAIILTETITMKI